MGTLHKDICKLEMFQTKIVEKIKALILHSKIVLRKFWRLWDNVQKYFTTGQAPNVNTTHAHCMLDT
jgi:hypothetical protein